MKRTLLFLFFVTGVNLICFSQNGLGFYHNYDNYFYVFDKGNERQLDINPVTDVHAGNDYLSYVDSKRSFMYYYDGTTTTLEENLPNQVVATPNALVYRMQQRLMICEKGEAKQLFRNVETFTAGDSIVVWQAYPSLNYMCYENGTINTILYATGPTDIHDFKVGSNIVAFNNANRDLKVYYKGEVYETGSNGITNYKCGHDLVAYVDDFKNTFSVFYNGEAKVLSEEIIQSYYVANDIVSFVDAKDNFYIFYKGGLTKVDSRKPNYIKSFENILCYSYDTNLKIVYNGVIYNEPLVSEENITAIGNSSVLFFSNVNTPLFFYDGKVIDHFYVPKPYVMDLSQDLPVFKYGSTIGFLYNGKMYEYGIRTN